MRAYTIGDKAETISFRVKNGESSSTIVKGTPVVLEVDGTDDGLSVVLPGSAAANANSLVFGVAIASIAAGNYGEVQAFGFNRYSILRRQTRGASTDSWASGIAISVGVMLNIDTVNNCFSTSGGTLAASAFLPFALAGESVASYASSASATSDTRTAITTSIKTFLRML